MSDYEYGAEGGTRIIRIEDNPLDAFVQINFSKTAAVAVVVPATERQAAAQALAGDEWRVVPAKQPGPFDPPLPVVQARIDAAREQVAEQRAGREIEQTALRNAIEIIPQLEAARDAAVARAEAAEQAVQRVRELHTSFVDDGVTYCDACRYAMPCPTARALDGTP